MAAIHEMYGKMAEDNQRLAGEYHRLLELLAQVKSGEMDVARVEVNLSIDSWTILPPAKTMPAEQPNGNRIKDFLPAEAATEEKSDA